MFGKVHIRECERGLWFCQGDFYRLLKPGTYHIWRRLWSCRDSVEVVNTLQTTFAHDLMDLLVEQDELRSELAIVDLSDTQRALIWKNDRLAYMAGPGLHAYWKEPYDVTVETFDVGAFEFTHPRMEAITEHPNAAQWLHIIDVDAHETVLLFRQGKLLKLLDPGRYIYWKGAGDVKIVTVDKREQTLDVPGQEIMTRDNVTLRVNLVVVYQVADPTLAITCVVDRTQALYREAQLALRSAIGMRSLDELLAEKEATGGGLADVLEQRASEFGLKIRNVGIRDIILPGEMRTLLNKVIEAEKEAKANLIRRREETAAARSQANTAKLLAENPTLARMKELEALTEVLAGTQSTFVLGDRGLSDQLTSMLGCTQNKKA